MSEPEKRRIMQTLEAHPWLVRIIDEVMRIFDHGEGRMVVVAKNGKLDKNGERIVDMSIEPSIVIRPLGRDQSS